MPSSPAPRVHYGWIIVATGTACVFAGPGLGRFASGMLRPPGRVGCAHAPRGGGADGG